MIEITTETRRASHEDILPKKELCWQQILEATIKYGPITNEQKSTAPGAGNTEGGDQAKA